MSPNSQYTETETFGFVINGTSKSRNIQLGCHQPCFVLFKKQTSDCQSVLILVNGKLVMRRDDLKCKVCRIKQQYQNFVHESVCFSKDFYLILVEKKRRDDLSSRKSPRITKNINGYTKRMSLQKGKKNRQAKHQD